MHSTDWSSLHQQIIQRMQATRQIFDTFFGDEEKTDSVEQQAYQSLWLDSCVLTDVQQVAPQYDKAQCQQLLTYIEQFKQDIDKRTIGQRGRDVLDKLIPMVFARLLTQSTALTILPRITQILLNIVSR